MIKRETFLFSLMVFCSIVIISCSKENDGNSGGNGGGGSTGGGATPGPFFTSVKSVIQSSCAVSGCHTGANPAGGHNFSNDATIAAQKDRIKVRAVDQAGTANQMPQPPNATLSPGDQKKITDWISAGGGITN